MLEKIISVLLISCCADEVFITPSNNNNNYVTISLFNDTRIGVKNEEDLKNNSWIIRSKEINLQNSWYVIICIL